MDRAQISQLTPQQQVRRERFESVIGLAAPFLDLVLTVGERISRAVGPADDYIPRDQVRAITDAVTADGRPTLVELYDGANHAFDNDDFFLHHPEASRQAWIATLAFLSEQLRG